MRWLKSFGCKEKRIYGDLVNDSIRLPLIDVLTVIAIIFGHIDSVLDRFKRAYRKT